MLSTLRSEWTMPRGQCLWLFRHICGVHPLIYLKRESGGYSTELLSLKDDWIDTLRPIRAKILRS